MKRYELKKRRIDRAFAKAVMQLSSDMADWDKYVLCKNVKNVFYSFFHSLAGDIVQMETDAVKSAAMKQDNGQEKENLSEHICTLFRAKANSGLHALMVNQGHRLQDGLASCFNVFMCMEAGLRAGFIVHTASFSAEEIWRYTEDILNKELCSYVESCIRSDDFSGLSADSPDLDDNIFFALAPDKFRMDAFIRERLMRKDTFRPMLKMACVSLGFALSEYEWEG